MRMSIVFVCLLMLNAAGAQEGHSAPEDADAAARRDAEFMNHLVRGYVGHAEGEDGTQTPLCLHEASLLNWSNPVSGVRPGGVYLWTHDDRPAAILKMYLHPRDGWFQQFSSLAPGKLDLLQQDGLSIWRPEQAGIDMSRVPDAPVPSNSPVLRLQQMRHILDAFTIYDGFQEQSEWVLRPLPKPLYRYGGPSSQVLDGAIFAFVQGTNPEVLLVLEAYSRDDPQRQYAWYSAIVRKTSYPARATYRDQPVWSVPVRYARQTAPEDVFYTRRFAPTAALPAPTP